MLKSQNDNYVHAKERISEVNEVLKQFVGKASTHEIDLYNAKELDELLIFTKLMSINIAMDAAKAGDEGRGFADVAMELNTAIK